MAVQFALPNGGIGTLASADAPSQPSEPVDLARERSFRRDDDAIRRDRQRGDERAFDDAIRVRSDDRAILERPGFSLGRVHDDRGRHTRRLVRHHCSPLAAGREARTAPAPQARGIDLVDRARRPEPPGSFEPGATTGRDVRREVGDGGRVEDA